MIRGAYRLKGQLVPNLNGGSCWLADRELMPSVDVRSRPELDTKFPLETISHFVRALSMMSTDRILACGGTIRC